MELAESPITNTDGTPIPLTLEAEQSSKQEHVTIEYWGVAIPEGTFGSYGSLNGPGSHSSIQTAPNNTYKAIRVISENYSIYYSVWCTNEREFYDLKVRHFP